MSYGNAPVYNQVRAKSPPKDDDEIAREVEQRHQELKRQIAIKEKQLAEMTGERDTADKLRSKLGLSRQQDSLGQF